MLARSRMLRTDWRSDYRGESGWAGWRKGGGRDSGVWEALDCVAGSGICRSGVTGEGSG